MPSLQTNHRLAIFFIAVSGMLYGCLGLFGTWMLKQGYSVSNMLFWRFATAALMILPMALKQIRSAKQNLGQGLRQSLRQNLNLGEISASLIGALLFSTSAALYFMACSSIGTGLSGVIFFSYPVFIFLCLWLFVKQPISRLSWGCLALVCVGFLLLNHGSKSAGLDAFGILIAVGAAVVYALYFLFSKKHAHDLDPWLSALILCLSSAAYFLIFSQFENSFLWPQSIQDWANVLALGFLATAAPILLMLLGLKSINADQAAIVSALEPVVSLALGVLFLEESLGLNQVFGMVIVLVGATASTLYAKTTH